MTNPPLAVRAAGEALGTALLLVAVVGSGIMAERLSGGNVGVALLANAVATGAALWVLIMLFAPVSGAHFNPAVTVMLAAQGDERRHAVLPMVAAQVAGAIAGVLLAHLMFDLAILQTGVKVRTGLGQWAGEFVATFGLVLVIELGRRQTPAAVPALVAAYITGAYWFTSSTSFANPAVTIARSLTDSFAGIAPGDAPGFILAQAAGATAAALTGRWFTRPRRAA
jgi:glycerol uptake facilitator-like aquaporin